MNISVIIPTLNEARLLSSSIDDAWRSGANEVIVVDGGSCDASPQIAQNKSGKLLETTAGRGHQLNVGAAAATGDVLLFLHADNSLVEDGCDQIRAALTDDRTVWGAFWQTIDSPRWIYRAIEAGNACRGRFLAMPYGDQGIFVRRPVFEQCGGFDELPLMEDFHFSRKLRRQFRFRLLRGPLTVSARRWQSNGPVRQTLKNWSIVVAAVTGTPTSVLARRYGLNRDSWQE